jgi:hypothetical protein
MDAAVDEWIGVEAKELTEESATAILKDWLIFARHLPRSHANLHEQAGIDCSRLAKLVSAKWKETPTPDELTRLSAVTGYPIHDLAVRASKFLHPQITEGLLPAEPLGGLPVFADS